MTVSVELQSHIRALGNAETTDKALAFIERLDHEHQLGKLIEAAQAISPTLEEALACVARACLEIINQEVSNRISKSAIKGSPYEIVQRAITELRRAGKPKIQRLMQHRSCGLESHRVAVRICQHAPYDSAKTVNYLQPSFWGRRPLLTEEGYVDHMYVMHVEQALTAAIMYMPAQDGRFVKAVVALVEALVPAIGSDIFARFRPEKVASHRLYALTIMSWAQLFLATANEYAHLMLTEVSVVDPDHWVEGGRIDALCPVQANGDKLPLEQRIEFRKAIAKRPPNVVELIKRLPSVGTDTFFRVDDYKFQVGDASHNYRELRFSEVEHRPLPGHTEQIKSYMSLLNVAYRKGRDLKRTPWDLPVAREGRLIYVFAERPPVIYSVVMTGEERLAFYEVYRLNRPELADKSEIARRTRKVVNAMKPVKPAHPSLF